MLLVALSFAHEQWQPIPRSPLIQNSSKQGTGVSLQCDLGLHTTQIRSQHEIAVRVEDEGRICCWWVGFTQAFPVVLENATYKTVL